MAIGKDKIGLDIDGVLADFYLAMCIKFNKPMELVKDYNISWIINQFHLIENDTNFWLNIPILQPPQSINFNVEAYITSSPLSMLENRKKWLQTHGFPKAPIIYSKDKPTTCKQLGISLFVDDCLANCQSFKGSSIKCIKFLPHYMKDLKHDHEINSLLEVPQHLK